MNKILTILAFFICKVVLATELKVIDKNNVYLDAEIIIFDMQTNNMQFLINKTTANKYVEMKSYFISDSTAIKSEQSQQETAVKVIIDTKEAPKQEKVDKVNNNLSEQK